MLNRVVTTLTYTKCPLPPFPVITWNGRSGWSTKLFEPTCFISFIHNKKNKNKILHEKESVMKTYMCNSPILNHKRKLHGTVLHIMAILGINTSERLTHVQSLHGYTHVHVYWWHPCNAVSHCQLTHSTFFIYMYPRNGFAKPEKPLQPL